MGSRITFLVLCLVLAWLPCSVTAQSTEDLLREEVEALRREVAELRAVVNPDDNWMSRQRQAEVEATIQQVLLEAEAAQQEMQRATAGFNGKKFYLASDDGAFLMQVSGQVQFRWLLDTQDGRADETESGFQLRRAKLHFVGHVGSPEIEYLITLAHERDDSNVFLERAQLVFTLDEEGRWTFSIGKFKLPFLRQELISSTRQVAVDRGVATEFFTLDFSEQATIRYEGDALRAVFGINDGADEELSDIGEDPVEIALTGRADLLLAGEWGQWSDNFAWEGEPLAVFLGGAFHWQAGDADNTGAPGISSPTTADYFGWTIDGSVEVNRFSVFAAVMGGHIDPDAGPGRDLYGVLIQTAYTIDDTYAPFFRYEWIDGDVAGAQEIHAVTAGVNYFLRSHNAKFTTDVVWVIDGDVVTNPFGNAAFGDGLGFSGFASGVGGDLILVRTQFQLLF